MLIVALLALASSLVSVLIARIGWSSFTHVSSKERSDIRDMGLFLSGAVLVIFGTAAISLSFFALGVLFYAVFP